MKSLFGRILFWFGITLAAALIGAVLTTFFITGRLSVGGPGMRPPPGPNDMFRRTLAYQLSESVHAYEQDGKPGLERFLRDLNNYYPGPHHLVDAQGNDVLTGRPLEPLPPKPNLVRINQTTPDGRYTMVTGVPPRPELTNYLPLYAWIIAVVVLLCYALAVTLAKPVRRLRDAVVRFGQGDLSYRTSSKRKDEIGDLERAFDDMADRLQTLLTAERRLLQDVSHELRSPLARLGFAVELARTSPDPDAALDRIKKEIRALTSLVDELIEVTRSEGDPEARQIEPINLNKLLESLATDVAIEAESRHCTLDLHAPQPVEVKGDPRLVRRAIENVVRNAIRHSPEGSAIDVDLELEPGAAVVGVRDYGQGVPEDMLSQIFRPFFRVDNDRNRNGGGVGLGLAIAQRALQLHGGEISAANMHPGLMVRLKLPA